MNSNLAYNTYTQNNIGIESPYKLIEMLYEGILRFNANAKRAIQDKDIEKRTYWIGRSSAVFTELLNSLDEKSGQIAYYLQGLYVYQMKLLSLANLNNDSKPIDEVNMVVKGLLEAWREETGVAR